MRFVRELILCALGLQACSEPSSSALRSNGQIIDPSERPQTLKLHDEDNGTCTGQLIEKNKLLTAAHCVLHIKEAYDLTFKDPETKTDFIGNAYHFELNYSKPEIYFKGMKVATAGEVIIHPAYLDELGQLLERMKKAPGFYGPGKFNYEEAFLEEFLKEIEVAGSSSGSDLAIIHLVPLSEHLETEIPIVTISKVPALVGQAVIIAGYGVHTFGSFFGYSMRVGENVLAEVTELYLNLSSPTSKGAPDPLHTIAFQGDSGGALYDKASDEIVGILSTAGTDQITDTSSYTNLHSDRASRFICQNLTGPCYR